VVGASSEARIDRLAWRSVVLDGVPSSVPHRPRGRCPTMEGSMNVVIVQGVLSRAPELRELPSGDRVGQFEVTVRMADRPTASVPVSWPDPPARALALDAGTEVLVTGSVRRRFFRTASGTGSRTEVLAAQLVPSRQRKRATAALDAALEEVLAAAG
jgi:single-strand DNA-binding protein